VPNATFVPVGLLYLLLPDGMSVDRSAPWQTIRYRNSDARPSVHDFGADHIMADYFFFRALESFRQSDKDDALEHFDECAKRLHGVKEMYNNIGSALAEHQLLREAVSYFQKAIELDDQYQSPRRNLALVKRRLAGD
jgi:tetratricopeptide (TPR) repeat protein